MDCDQPSPQLQSTVDPHPTPDSWHQAVTDYTNTLTPSQQREFKAPATVEQCLQILTDNRTRKKAFTRILELVRPIVDPLKRFEGAIDVVVQISSGIASPIWGPLRLVITVGLTCTQPDMPAAIWSYTIYVDCEWTLQDPGAPYLHNRQGCEVYTAVSGFWKALCVASRCQKCSRSSLLWPYPPLYPRGSVLHEIFPISPCLVWQGIWIDLRIYQPSCLGCWSVCSSSSYKGSSRGEREGFRWKAR